MSELLPRIVGTATVLVSAALLAVVGAVGTVAVVAEMQKTWIWYRRMEKVAHAAVEPAVALLAVCLACYVGLVVVADR